MFWCKGGVPRAVAAAVLIPTWVCFHIQDLSCTHFLSELEGEIALLGYPHIQGGSLNRVGELPERFW